jgi:hypothetical protein
MAENLKLAKALRETEMRPTPRSGLTGMLADALMGARNFADRAKVPDFVPLIGGEGVGSLLVGKAPEEVNELSYGNSPIQMNPYAGRTASFVPEMKRGRGQQLADALSLLSLPGGKTAASMMMGAVPGVDAAATVFHGSPHKFDRFDSSKIGTGEGAQAYGHGLYLAESPEVAKEYATRLTKNQYPVGKLSISQAEAAMWDAQNSANKMLLTDEHLSNPQAYQMAKNQAAAARTAWETAIRDEGKQFYKVDLPDEAIAKMLDWDKPLSQQAPEVRRAIQKTKTMLPPNAIDDLGGNLSLMYGPNVTPNEFLNTWESLGRKAGGETALQQLGIPGIRYLDAGSRGTGTGTSNYVVFPGNENLLTILERNGQLLGTK